jgi:serine protease
MMKRSFPFRWLASIALCLPLYAQAAQTDRIIIKVSESKRLAVLADGGPAIRARERLATLSAAAGRDVVWVRAMSGGADVLRLPHDLPIGEVAAMAAALAKLPGVAYAEPDRRVLPALTPNDPRFAEQWHLQAVNTIAPINYGIDAPAAWDITTGGTVTVAVLDTGVLFAHADLAGKLLPGYDFISFDSPGVFRVANDGDGRDPDASDPGDWVTAEEASLLGCEASDSSWHGTHVAGTIAAATNNGVGVAGVNWQAMILPLRVLGKCGGYTSDTIDAMRWATGLPVLDVPQNPNPARILNLSLGAPGSCDLTWQQAIDDVNARGAVVVVAAGNNGEDLSAAPLSPAVCSGVLTVAASERGGNKASYSNYGSAVAVSAPGGTIGNPVLSTLDGGLTVPMQDSETGPRFGTSMATAHVAGVASLLLSRNPGLTREQVVAALTGAGSVTAFPDDSICAAGGCGSGILNAHLALGVLVDGGDASVPPPSSSGGGGGALGGWLLAGLVGYGALRRARTRKPPQEAPASAP